MKKIFAQMAKFTLVCAALWPAADCPAQVIGQRLKSFAYGADSGAFSQAPLILGSDGWLYGTMSAGASPMDAGTIFKVNIDGTGYAVLPDEPGQGDVPAEAWAELHHVLDEAPHKLTRAQVLMRWPTDETPPSEQTLWRWLNQSVADGLLCRDGAGNRGDPYYYWLPGKLEEWERDPLFGPLQRQLEMLRQRGGLGDRG